MKKIGLVLFISIVFFANIQTVTAADGPVINAVSATQIKPGGSLSITGVNLTKNTLIYRYSGNQLIFFNDLISSSNLSQAGTSAEITFKDKAAFTNNQELADPEQEWNVGVFNISADRLLVKWSGTLEVVTDQPQRKDQQIDVSVSVYCGSDSDRKMLADVPIKLSANTGVIMESTSQNTPINMVYTIPQGISNEKYSLSVPDTPSVEIAKVQNKEFLMEKKTVDFYYSSCPTTSKATSKSKSQSQSQQSATAQDQTSANQNQASASQQITNITISNYLDFRSDNGAGDIGSPTETVQSGSSVIWTLPTLDSKAQKRIYIKETGDYFDLSDGQEIEVADVKIKVQLPKKTVKMTITINGKDQEVDLNNPNGISVKLEGTAGKAQTFSIPYVKEYSNGEIERSAFEIDYQPTPTPSPAATCAPTTCSYSQAVDTGVCDSGVQLVEGTGCSGANCQGCTYVPGCSPEPTCAANSDTPEPTGTATSTPTSDDSWCTKNRHVCSNIGADLGTCTKNGQSCRKYETYQCNVDGVNYCGDGDNSECREPCGTPAPSSNYCTDAGYVECTVGEKNGTCTKDSQTCTAYNRYACNYGGKNYCDSNNPSCGDPCTAPPSNNYCTDAGYVECTVGEKNGTCTKDSQTCTAYNRYACNYGGKNYCDSNNPSCGDPCETSNQPIMCYFSQVDADDETRCYEGTCTDNNDCWTNHRCVWNGDYNGTDPVDFDRCL